MSPVARIDGDDREGHRQPAQADPRVEHRDRDVDDEVGQHDAQRSEQHRPEEERQVLLGHRVDGQLADAPPREDRLDDDHAAEQHADVEPDLDEDRWQGVAEGMPPRDQALRGALRPGGPGVVLVQLVEQRGPGQPGVVRGEADAEGDRRQEEVAQVPWLVAADRAGCRGPTGPSGWNAKQVDEEVPDEERRRGHEDGRPDDARPGRSGRPPGSPSARRSGCR